MTTHPKYEFTLDWFQGCEDIWRQLIPLHKPRRIIEIGSFEGRSACWLIEQCAAEGPLEIHCIDTWAGSIEHQGGQPVDMRAVEQRFDTNTAAAILAAPHPVSLFKHKSESGLALARLIASDPPPVDLIYVDGSHLAPDVMTDAVLAFRLLRTGGMMIFDDYFWEPYWLPPEARNPRDTPKLAIDAFWTIFGRRLSPIKGAPMHQLYFIKVDHSEAATAS